MESRLPKRLEELAQIRRRARLGRTLALCWLVAVALGLALLAAQPLFDWEFSRIIRLSPVILGIVLTVVALNRQTKSEDEIQRMLGELEKDDPNVRHLF